MKRKRKAMTLVLILLLALLIPIRLVYKDGGSIEWRAVLWQVRKFHRIEDNGYRVGTRITLFMGYVTIYDDTVIVPYEPDV